MAWLSTGPNAAITSPSTESHLGKPTKRLTMPTQSSLTPTTTPLSGQQVRTIGYSPSARTVLSVITLDKEGVVWGVNAWKSNSRDGSYYREGGPDEQEP
jgi:hypothetical protein